MLLARVVGTVVATRKDPRLVSNKLLLARSMDPHGKAEGNYLVAQAGGLRYPIRDGFPVMLIEEAKLPQGVESLEDLRQKLLADGVETTVQQGLEAAMNQINP